MERCSMAEECAESLYRVCCEKFFCKRHYKQHTAEVHRSSAFYRPPTSDEVAALRAGFEAISHSRHLYLKRMLVQQNTVTSRQEIAREARRLVSESEADCQAILEMEMKGIPAASESRIPACFLKASAFQRTTLIDEFLWVLARVGYISASIADVLYRRSQPKVEVEQSDMETVQDLQRCIEIQSTLCVSTSTLALTEVLLSKACLQCGDWKLAEDHANSALQGAAKNPFVKAEALVVLASIRYRQNNLSEASKYFAQAGYAQQDCSQTPEMRRLASINLGFAYELQEKFERALRRFEKAKVRTVELYGPEDYRTACIMSYCARMNLRIGKNKSAETLYLQCLPLLQGNASYLKGVYEGLCRIYSVARHYNKLLQYTELHLSLLQPHEFHLQVELVKNLILLCAKMELHDRVRHYQQALHGLLNLMSVQ